VANVITNPYPLVRGLLTRAHLGAASLVILASLVPPTLSAADQSENPDHDFRFRGRPINPLIIKQFETWISDDRPPITVEINVTAAWKSNQYPADFNIDPNGLVSVNIPQTTTYSYQHLGRMDNGMHVLRTFESGGGSGVFQFLLFVRFHTDNSYLADGMKEGEQLFLRVVRRFPLGDRDTAQVVVRKDRVLVGESRYREHQVVLSFEEPHASSRKQKKSN
jgi:hypothetical protein